MCCFLFFLPKYLPVKWNLTKSWKGAGWSFLVNWIRTLVQQLFSETAWEPDSLQGIGNINMRCMRFLLSSLKLSEENGKHTGQVIQTKEAYSFPCIQWCCLVILLQVIVLFYYETVWHTIPLCMVPVCRITYM